MFMPRQAKPISWNPQKGPVDPGFTWFWRRPPIGVWPFWSDLTQDLMRFSPLTRPATIANAAVGVGRAGRLVRISANNDSALYSSSARLYDVSGMTLVSVWEKNGWESNNGLYGHHGNGSDVRWFGFWTDTTANQITAYNYNTGGSFQEATIAANAVYYDGRPTVTVATHEVGAIRLYAGKLGGGSYATASNTSGGCRVTGDGEFTIGDYDKNSQTHPWNGGIYYVAWLPFVVSRERAQQLIVDPFGPFHMATRRLAKVVAAPGARPQGPLGHPLHGPLAGPIAA